MESPSSTVRRRAWINSSRQWLNLEDVDPEGLSCNLPSTSIADDDVFSDGCFTGKIENWLLGCGSEARAEVTGQLSFESVLKANNCDDELGLGADASVLNVGEITPDVSLTQQPSSRRARSRLTSTPRQSLCPLSLSLGQSIASSCLSSSTCKTTSSVSEVLQLCSEDPEETLYELGFGCDEPQVTVRIPPRFFTFPSLAQGINFRLFLDSQLRRIREEDPGLSLASRFRQVQVLTAMANAFYSLYSHVSRTPLQKLAAPEYSFASSPAERIERFRSSVRSEPRSPVERLKDTVSKMCLYTGSPRGSDSTSPQPSPRKRSSLPDVVDIVLDKVKNGATKRLDLGEHDRRASAVDVRLVTDGDEPRDGEKEEQQTVAGTDTAQNRKHSFHKKTQSINQTDNVDDDFDSRTHGVRTSLASSLSGETVIETGQPELDSCSAHSETTTHQRPVARVTYDLICPQIVESVHQAPFCKHNLKTNTLPCISSETEHIGMSCPGSQQQTAVSEDDEDSRTGESRSPPVSASDGSYTQCCITVTGWEGDSASSCSPNAPDSSQASADPRAQTCEVSFNEGKSRYLNPLTLQGLGHVTNNLQQVNSFELEEVHSAGEEDSVHLENPKTTNSSKIFHYKGEVVRGDSIQSDSSGYADEEVSPSQSTLSR